MKAAPQTGSVNFGIMTMPAGLHPFVCSKCGAEFMEHRGSLKVKVGELCGGVQNFRPPYVYCSGTLKLKKS